MEWLPLIPWSPVLLLESIPLPWLRNLTGSLKRSRESQDRLLAESALVRWSQAESTLQATSPAAPSVSQGL